MPSIIQQRALTRIQDTGFTRAKKLADLALKKNVDSSGKTTAKGYEQAIEILTPFEVSDSGNESIDAQRLTASYSNSLLKMKEKSNKINRAVNQLKIDEREIFYITPTSGNRAEIMRDVPNMVNQISDELSLHIFSIESAIEEANIKGDSTAELESYLFDVQKRQRMMSELNNDFLNGEISPGEALNGYGVFVDSDPNDGELQGITIAPLNDLPPGVEKSNFKRVDSSVEFGGAFIPVLGKFSEDGLGVKTVKIGNQVWEGTGDYELQYSKKKSATPQFKNNPGEFSLTNVPDKGVAMRAGRFAKGYTGFDAEGNPQETMFYTANDGKTYSLDEEAKSSFKNDPVMSQEMSRAVSLESSFAKNLASSEGVQPLRFSPITAEGQQQMTATSAAFTEQQMQKEQQKPSFFESKNRMNKPEKPSIGSSAPDIVEVGKGFFRKAQSFFSK